MQLKKEYAQDMVIKSHEKKAFFPSVLPFTDINYVVRIFYQENAEYLAVYSLGKFLGYITKETLRENGYIN